MDLILEWSSVRTEGPHMFRLVTCYLFLYEIHDAFYKCFTITTKLDVLYLGIPNGATQYTHTCYPYNCHITAPFQIIVVNFVFHSSRCEMRGVRDENEYQWGKISSYFYFFTSGLTRSRPRDDHHQLIAVLCGLAWSLACRKYCLPVAFHKT